MKKRQSFDKVCKAKVVLEALREELTLQEIAKQYDVYPNQISLWKGHGKLAWDLGKTKQENGWRATAETQYDEALKTLGAMKIENEFLKKGINHSRSLIWRIRRHETPYTAGKCVLTKGRSIVG